MKILIINSKLVPIISSVDRGLILPHGKFSLGPDFLNQRYNDDGDYNGGRHESELMIFRCSIYL